MSWRVLANGPMLEITAGTAAPGQKEVTSVVFGHEGMLIEEPRDLSKPMRERYEAGDESIMALVEYGEIQTTEVDGETVKTFVPKGIAGAADATPADPDVLARAEEAEGEVTALRTQVTELEQQLEQATAQAATAAQESEASASELQAKVEDLEKQLGELEAERDEAVQAAQSALTYGELDKDALELEAAAKKVDVKRGDGSDKPPVKADYVKALEEARAANS